MNPQPALGAQAEPEAVQQLPTDPHGAAPAVFEGAMVVEQPAGVAPVPVEMVTPLEVPPPVTPSPYEQPVVEQAPVTPAAPELPQNTGVPIPVRVESPAVTSAPVEQPKAPIVEAEPVRVEEVQPAVIEHKTVEPIISAPEHQAEPVAHLAETHIAAPVEEPILHAAHIEEPKPIPQEPVVVVVGKSEAPLNLGDEVAVTDLDDSDNPALVAEGIFARNMGVGVWFYTGLVFLW